MRRSSGVSAALGGASGPSAGQGHPISSINEIRLNGRENFVLGKIIGGGMWALCTVTEISLRESPLDCKNRGKTTASAELSIAHQADAKDMRKIINRGPHRPSPINLDRRT